MSNKGLLIIIAVILLGIFSVVLIEATRETPMEQIADEVGQMSEKVSMKIDG